MENLKIRVNSADESKKAQELFFKLGGSWAGYKKIHDWPEIKQLYLGENYITFSNDINFFVKDSSKEITLPELRAMANQTNEYLEPLPNGEYKYHSNLSLVGGDWIRIPEGAIRARFYPHDPDGLEFENAFYQWWHGKNKEWVYYADYAGTVEYSRVVWQRATHPEELPFIDDEPKYTDDEVKYMDENGQWWLQSINDQYAEIEQVRQVEIHGTVKAEPDLNFGAAQAIKVKSGSDSDHAADAMSYGFMGVGAASGGAKDNVNHPSHYADNAIECIDAMEAMMTTEQFIGYLRGNLFKYQWRYEKKNGIEDLKKAQWYLEKLTVKIAEKNAPF